MPLLAQARQLSLRREHSHSSDDPLAQARILQYSPTTIFPEVYVEKLTQLHYDHCPKLIRCEGDNVDASNRPFRFKEA
ncbi:hypothetical protein Lal_00035397 [Lupinus albus]|nr:hypothetical protein Lal_00035397 [Lupinus albus]